jgi:hypothetical protein
MNPKIQTKTDMSTVPSKALKAIFEELRLLRNEVMLLLPQEDLEEYTHSNRIRRSYQKAVKKYPPVSLWK